MNNKKPNINNKKVNSGNAEEQTPPMIPIIKAGKRIKSIEDAKKLLSKIISEFCKGNMLNRNAKDLAYLLSIYVSLVKDGELEKRIEEIENKLGLTNGNHTPVE